MAISAEKRERMGIIRAEQCERAARLAESERHFTEALIWSDEAARWREWAAGFSPED